MKKFISVLLALIMALSVFATVSFAEEGERTMKFNSDGKLRVMHVTDTHFEDYNASPSCWAIGYACDKEKPDIVVITGDNVQNCENPDDTKKLIDKLMTVFEERNIPVAVTFGNHDSEAGPMTRADIMEYYNIPFERTMAFGDGHNDIGLFKAVKTSIAMKNAHPSLLEIATHTTDSNLDQGVLKFLKEYFK